LKSITKNFKIKVFRTGKYEIHGITPASPKVEELIDEVMQYLKQYFSNIENSELHILMINFKTRMYYDNLPDQLFEIKLNKFNNILLEYLNKTTLQIKLTNIDYTIQGSNKLRLKFYQNDRKTTIVIYSSGKINTLGCKNFNEADMMIKTIIQVISSNMYVLVSPG
jgi:TATA-box binding protein (TBP) (component of TFIID and TFIIIB)